MYFIFHQIIYLLALFLWFLKLRTKISALWCHKLTISISGILKFFANNRISESLLIFWQKSTAIIFCNIMWLHFDLYHIWNVHIWNIRLVVVDQCKYVRTRAETRITRSHNRADVPQCTCARTCTCAQQTNLHECAMSEWRAPSIKG